MHVTATEIDAVTEAEKLSSIDHRGQTDRVTTPTRAEILCLNSEWVADVYH